jgi:dihydrofolate synthase/folylpolyglutamate synthase
MPKRTTGSGKAGKPANPDHAATPSPRVSAQVEAKVPAGTPAAGAPLPEINDFPTAVRYLYDRVDLERARPTPELRDQYKLDRMRAILAELGDPQDAIRTVHVAGTKGKGSTCEMTAACLEACGYTVGLFTSPHIVSILERIRLNRRNIPEADFTAALRRAAAAALRVAPRHGDATFFELTTAMGFLYFVEQAVDVAVVEVGLGGLLDCTNVIRPEVTAITTIGHDHTQILGNTLAEIAAQKAGILKPGVPALTVVQEPEAAKVIKETAQAVGAPLEVVGEDVDFSFRFEWQGGTATLRVNFSSGPYALEHVTVPLRGEHQAINCGLALAIVAKLAAHGFHCPEEKVLRGLATTKLPGRFEVAWDSPRVLLDGAHNPESIRALIKAIGAYLTYDSLVVVFGCAADKDIETMLRHLASGADKVIFTKSNTPRAANPDDLARRYSDISGKGCQSAPTFKDALELAARSADRDDLICVTGSFYLVGEAKARLAEVAAKKAEKAGPGGRATGPRRA